MKELKEGLGNAFPFSCLTKKELDSLMDGAGKLNLTRKDVLYRPGVTNDYIYLVLSGGIKVSKSDGSDMRFIIDIYPPGSVIGDDVLLSPESHDTEARPLDRASVIRVDRKKISKLLDKNPRFAHAWLEMAGSRTREYRDKMEDLVFKEVKTRLAGMLFKLARSFGRRDRQGTVITARITHQDLADCIGASRETVSLSLAEMRRKKLIRMNVRRIIVPDMKMLKKASSSNHN